MLEVPERVLFVHAHPDDETISTGGTIALLIARGAQVTVVTCTRGEQGEVIPMALAHLQGVPEALANHREAELEAALTLLGVTDHRYLGSLNARWSGNPVRQYRDSGMRWGASGAEAVDDVDELALTRATFGEVASDIAAVIADTEPHAVISYNSHGGYGHPDHVLAHEAARHAAEVMGVSFFVIEPDESTTVAPSGTPVAGLVRVDVTDFLGAKRAALAAHETQVTVGDGTFALSNGVSHPIGVTESFRLVRPGEDAAAGLSVGRSGTSSTTASDTFRDSSLVAKILTIVATAIGGTCAGFIFTAVHQATVAVGSITIPLGLIIGLGGTTALLLGLRITFDSRLLSAVGALAVLSATALLSAPTAGGSIVVPANPAGYLWTFGSALIALVVLAWPRVVGPASGKIERIPAVKGSSIP